MSIDVTQFFWVKASKKKTQGKGSPMATKNIKIYQPTYFRDFTCQPMRCQESCCERWQIIIDQKTYETYATATNPIIQNIVKSGLTKNESPKGMDDYARINLDSNLACPFLNGEKLCEVILNLGEVNLSKTCKSYPRAIVEIQDQWHRGLEMSCSVAAEDILLNQQGISFEWVEETINTEDYYYIKTEVTTSQGQERLNQSLLLRDELIACLQNRNIELHARLNQMGQMLEKISEKGRRAAEAQSPVKPFETLNELLSMKFKEGDTISFFSKRYIDCLMTVLDVYGKVKAKNLESSYENHYQSYLKPYLSSKPYLLENYLVNYLFVYGMDSLKAEDPWEAYVKLCIVYGLIRLNLTGLGASKKGMNDETALKLIQSLTKTLVTDHQYMAAVVKHLEKSNLISRASLMALVAN